MKEEARGGGAHHTKRRLHKTAVPQIIEGTHPSLSQQPPPSPRTCNMRSWLTSLSSTWTHITQAPDYFLAISFRLLIMGQGLDENDRYGEKDPKLQGSNSPLGPVITWHLPWAVVIQSTQLYYSLEE